MIIHKTQTGSNITLAISGKLDSVTQAELTRELEMIFETNLTGLVFDLSALEYISSAGLRVLLSARKKAQEIGATMRIVKATESVREIFRIISFPLDD